MKNLVEQMRTVAAKHQANVLVCEGWDERCIRAAANLTKDNICKISLLGNPTAIRAEAKRIGVDLTHIELVDHTNAALKETLAQHLYEARKHKGMTIESAHTLIDDVNYFGCMYALTGRADAVAGSAICPTGDLMRPALQLLRGQGVVSEISVLTDETAKRRFIFSDASLNIDPDAGQLASIAENAVAAAQQFDIVPRVAFLSFSTKGSGGDTPDTLRVREATTIFTQNHPQIIADGEMQFDAAVNPESAARKCPNSPIKGDANILILPNLTAANILMHALLQVSRLKFEFTLVCGTTKPVGIIGRSSNVEATENVLVSCAMRAKR